MSKNAPRCNGWRQLLHGFRQSKNYEAIRTDMAKDEGYKNNKSNVFMFPDEALYQRHIRDVLKTPLKINIQLHRDGQPYNIDQD